MKAEITIAAVAKRADEQRQHVTARKAWDAYVTERAPHWGERQQQDRKIKAPAGPVFSPPRIRG